MKEKNEKNLDNEIWVQNKIEEARQETENLIYEQIKSLDYNKTIKDFNEALQKLSKQIELVDYNKDRALEGLEEDFSIKLDDIKTLNEDALKDMIINITGNSLDKKMEALEKKFSKEINKSFQKLDIIKENNATEDLTQSFEEYKKIVNIDELKKNQEKLITSVQKLEEINIDEIKAVKTNITNIEAKYKQDIEDAISILKDKVEQSINEILNDAQNKQLEITEYKKQIEEKIAKLEKNENSIIEYKSAINKDMEELQESQRNIEDDFVAYQKEIDEDISKCQEETKRNTETYQKNIENSIQEYRKEVNDKVDLMEEIHNNQENIDKKLLELKDNEDILKKQLLEQNELVIPELGNIKEELFKVRENTANKLLALEKGIEEKFVTENKEIEEKFSKLLSELDIESIKEAKKQQAVAFEQMKNYVEKRILRMKYVTTIQALVKEIDKLKNTIAQMQTQESNNNTDDERIMQLVDKQVKQTISQMIKEQKTKQSKVQKASNATQKVNNKVVEKVQSKIVEKQGNNKKALARKEVENLSLEEALKDSPVEKIVNTTRAISNIARGIRKSQILNSPEEQD